MSTSTRWMAGVALAAGLIAPTPFAQGPGTAGADDGPGGGAPPAAAAAATPSTAGHAPAHDATPTPGADPDAARTPSVDALLAPHGLRVREAVLRDGEVIVWLEPVPADDAAPRGEGDVVLLRDGEAVGAPGGLRLSLLLRLLAGAGPEPSTPNDGDAATRSDGHGAAPGALRRTLDGLGAGLDRTWDGAAGGLDRATQSLEAAMTRLGAVIDDELVRARAELGQVGDELAQVGHELGQAADELAQAADELGQAADELGQVLDELCAACHEVVDEVARWIE